MNVYDKLLEARGKLVALRNPENGRLFRAALKVWPDYGQPVLFGIKIPEANIDRLMGGESDVKLWTQTLEVAK